MSGRDVEDIWKDHFDYFYREYGKSFHVSLFDAVY